MHCFSFLKATMNQKREYLVGDKVHSCIMCKFRIEKLRYVVALHCMSGINECQISHYKCYFASYGWRNFFLLRVFVISDAILIRTYAFISSLDICKLVMLIRYLQVQQMPLTIYVRQMYPQYNHSIPPRVKRSQCSRYVNKLLEY